MSNKNFFDRKELLLATGAAMTLGIGATLAHQTLTVQATTVSDATANNSSEDVGTQNNNNTNKSGTEDETTNGNETDLKNTTNNDVSVDAKTGSTVNDTTNSESSDSIQNSNENQISSLSEQTGSIPSSDNSSKAVSSSVITVNPAVENIAANDTYTDADKFTWSVDDTTTEATVTGLNSDENIALNIPPTVTLKNSNNEDKTYNVTTIGSNAFVGKKNFTSVQINDGITTIGDGAFAYTNLTDLNLTNNTTLKTIGDLAFTSDQIKDLNLPDSVTDIGKNAFEYNNALENLVLPKSLENIGDLAFAMDGNIKTIDFSQATNLKIIGSEAFEGNTSLQKVDLSNNNQLEHINNGAFIYNSKVESVMLPDSLKTIGDQAFLSNIALTAISFGTNLTSIGKMAFTYDSKLARADFSQAVNLNSIDDGAFEYAGLTGNLMLPDSLKTIGDLTFAGNQLTSVDLGSNIQKIGTSAFVYNKLDSLASATSNDISVGANAFSYNRITKIAMPNVDSSNKNFDLNSAVQQLAVIFTDTEHNHISNYFSINIGGTTEKNMNISNLTNGVTYSNGVFTIPVGVTSFNFDWSLSAENVSDKGYAGTYDVVLDDPSIRVFDTKIPAGSKWNKSDNFISAITTDGQQKDLSDLTVSIVDANGNTGNEIDTTNGVSSYQVTYSYGNESETANVYVYKIDAIVDIIGTDSKTYNGQQQNFDLNKYQAILSNKSTYTLKDGDLKLVEDATNVGTYKIVLTDQGKANIEASNPLYNWNIINSSADLVINKAPVIIKVNDVTKIIGQDDPTFSAAVTMPDGLANDIVYELIRKDGESIGDYPIDVSYDSDKYPNYDIKVESGTLKISDNLRSITGSNYTMHVGDPTPTAADFKASATDENGQPLDISVDLSQAILDAPGKYQVRLFTTDGQGKMVSLNVLAKDNTGAGGGTDPTDPT
ncbi:MAG TPA: hypothetical protein DEQ50_08475, partial [Lactobacillus sp.]|nr:hypothetical protein [Lactobacillus sp.]